MDNAIKQLSDRYLDARAAYDDLSARTREAKEIMDSAEAAMLSYMTDIGVDSFKTDDGVGFSMRRKLSYACCAADRPELLNRLEKEGFRDLFTISPQSLNALMKEKAAASEDGILPAEYADIVTENEEHRLSVRGRKQYRT